jgi:hypothetical protein
MMKLQAFWMQIAKKARWLSERDEPLIARKFTEHLSSTNDHVHVPLLYG